MEQLVVDFAALEEATDSLTNHIDATEEKLNRVEQIVIDLESSWEGAAHEGFRATVAEWSSAARDLHTQLRRIRDFVVTAHGNHASAVHTNIGIWRV
ncbi:WXG100 family type VII secretion target [Gandjariella thermophila]|uniref:ESAT-6-like protein n=1 Tax=Gandjariella thermophila TaxID=1931992 RepID=A0A4D4JB16_9PSEU|nr:WXG100 family type VII secretion target [Gandjariella thermophila]GDY34015.1 hypothetical protein GTS_56480 [Gandjariella thermophila]